MEMSKEDAEIIVGQLQQAHRISVAFYRRILPTLDMIANQLECSFLNWKPLITSLPSRRTQPSKSWAWDYVPLYASTHTYKHVRGELKTGPDDFAIVFDLYIEDSFADEKFLANGQPDAIEMPIGQAVLKVYLYRPVAVVNESFDNLWLEETEVYPALDNWSIVSKNWKGIAFEWPLTDVISNSQSVIKAIQLNLNKHSEKTENTLLHLSEQ